MLQRGLLDFHLKLELRGYQLSLVVLELSEAALLEMIVVARFFTDTLLLLRLHRQVLCSIRLPDSNGLITIADFNYFA